MFVSHNMIAVENLCTKCILLRKGILQFEGAVDEVLNKYTLLGAGLETSRQVEFTKGIFTITLLDKSGNQNNTLALGTAFSIEFNFKLKAPLIKPNIGIGINNRYGQRVITYHTSYQLKEQVDIVNNTKIVCHVPELILMPGTYFIEVSIFENNNTTIFNQHNLVQFEANVSDYYGTGKLPVPSYQGMVVGKALWQ